MFLVFLYSAEMSKVCKQFNPWEQQRSRLSLLRVAAGPVLKHWVQSPFSCFLGENWCHNSVEQKFVVKTPSCATNVSDHSSLYGVVVAFVRSVLRLDFLLKSELFLRLSWALTPTFKTTFCTIPSERRPVGSFSFASVEFNKQTGEVDNVEHLLYCGMVNLSFGDRSVNRSCSSEIYHWQMWAVRNTPLYWFSDSCGKRSVWCQSMERISVIEIRDLILVPMVSSHAISQSEAFSAALMIPYDIKSPAS